MNPSKLLAAALLLMSCAAQAETLTVAVAANMRNAFTELAAEFGKEDGVEVKSVFSSSGKIVSQVENGAPFDVFLSADTEFPDVLYKEGLAASASRVYAYGVLVLWTKKDIDLGKGVAVVNDAAVQKVAIANPKLAPYGRAAMKALEKAGLDRAIESKLVYAENITQTLQFADSGAADIGFVAKSLVITPEMAGKGKWVDVPKSSYDPIAQGVVVLKHGAKSPAARKLVDFLFTPRARAIFEKYGYLLP